MPRKESIGSVTFSMDYGWGEIGKGDIFGSKVSFLAALLSAQAIRY